MMQEQ